MELLIAVLITLIVLLVSGYVIAWAWNTFVVKVWETKEITTIEGLALFLLAFMLLGFWRFI